MGVLRFTSSGSNRVKWTTLAQALKDVGDGAYTGVWVLKRATDDAVFHGLGYLLSGTGNGIVEAGLSLNGSDNLVYDGDGFPASNLAITGTTETYMVVVTKAAGLSPLTYSRYVKSTGVWTHHSPGSLADQIDATMLELGAWQNGDFFNGWIGVNAWYEGAMSQAQKEALVTNWRTSDLWTSAFGQPQFLVELNAAAASLVDLAGNASGVTATGTSLDAAETLAAWNFDGTGATTTPVSSTVSVPWEATAPVATAAAANWEALAPASALAAAAYEAGQGLAATARAAWEAAAGAAGLARVPFEALAAALATGQSPWESASQVSGQASTPYESLQRAELGASLPWEAAVALLAARSAPWESLVPASAAASGPWEALVGVIAARSLPWEADGNFAVLALASIPWESLQQLAPVVTTAPYESVQGGVQALRSLPWEGQAGAARSLSAPWEAIARADSLLPLPYESLAPVTRSSAAAWESLQGVQAIAVLPWEALALLERTLRLSWEALDGSPPTFEAFLTLAAGEGTSLTLGELAATYIALHARLASEVQLQP